MKLSFDIDLDDVIAFHSHYYDFKSAGKVARQLKLTWVCICAVIVATGGILSLLHKDWNYLLLGGIVVVVFSFVWFIGFGANSERRVKSDWLRKARKAVDIPENRLLIGERTMEFEDEEVRYDTAIEHQVCLWNAFIRASETDDHFFLYIADAQAHIIPKRTMSTEQIDELSQLLNNKIKK